jgi:hypothetical protein
MWDERRASGGMRVVTLKLVMSKHSSIHTPIFDTLIFPVLPDRHHVVLVALIKQQECWCWAVVM